MKQRILLFLSLFLVLMSVFAFGAILPSLGNEVSESKSFSVSYDTVVGSILQGDKAEFTITVINNENKTLDFDLDFSNAGEWSLVNTDPLYYGLTGVEVGPNSAVSFSVVVKSRSTTAVSSYAEEVTVIRKDTSESVLVLLPVSVESLSSMNGVYQPNIKVSVSVGDKDGKIDPRQENNVRIVLKNNNFRNISNLTIELEGVLLGKKTIVDSLAPMEAKTKIIPLLLDDRQAPIVDTISAVVYADGVLFTPAVKTFSVVDYTSELTKVTVDKSSFLKKENIITLTNEGNVVKGEQVRIEKSWLQKLFSSYSQDPQVLDVDGKEFLSWYVELEPAESLQLKVSTSYRPLFYIFIFLAIALVLFFLFKSPLVVTKRFTNIGTKEGGISDVKVLIKIKNSGNHRIKDVEVSDRIPHIADIKSDFPVGTVKPDKILSNKNKGTIVKWKLDDVDAHEERIINYEMKAKLPILGNLTLSPVIIRYRTPKGREVVVRSNRLVVSQEGDDQPKSF